MMVEQLVEINALIAKSGSSKRYVPRGGGATAAAGHKQEQGAECGGGRLNRVEVGLVRAARRLPEGRAQSVRIARPEQQGAKREAGAAQQVRRRHRAAPGGIWRGGVLRGDVLPGSRLISWSALNRLGRDELLGPL